MNSLTTIVIVIVAVAICLVLIYLFGTSKNSGKSTGKSKNRNVIIRDATKKLAQNPHHVPALNALSDLYYREHLWDKAFPLFDLMLNLAPSNKDIDIGQYIYVEKKSIAEQILMITIPDTISYGSEEILVTDI